MSVARVTEISSTSDKGFEDAIQQGIARATQTLHGIRAFTEARVRVNRR
jgi:flavin-binding protein dodecin